MHFVINLNHALIRSLLVPKVILGGQAMIHNFDPRFERTDGCETDFLRILYYDLAQGYEETYRSYQYPRLCTIAKGEKQVKINQADAFTYQTSDFIVLPPNTEVHMRIGKPTTAIVYEISDHLIDSTLNRLQNQLEDDLQAADAQVDKLVLDPNMRLHLNRINSYAASNDPNKGFLIDLCAQELTYHMIKSAKINAAKFRRTDPIAYTLAQLGNPQGNAPTVMEIAHHLNMSPSNLITLFKKKTGMTPKEYQKQVKLTQALQALKHKSVSEVCYDLGFESTSYFIKLFREAYGITPKQFMLQQIGAK